MANNRLSWWCGVTLYFKLADSISRVWIGLSSCLTKVKSPCSQAINSDVRPVASWRSSVAPATTRRRTNLGWTDAHAKCMAVFWWRFNWRNRLINRSSLRWWSLSTTNENPNYRLTSYELLRMSNRFGCHALLIRAQANCVLPFMTAQCNILVMTEKGEKKKGID